MPPKRASPAGQGAAKKSKTVQDSDAPTPSAPRNKRWASLSVSANADVEYHEYIQNPLQAYKYVLFCMPPISHYRDSHDSDEEDEEEGDEDQKDGDGETADKDKDKTPKPRCDGGKACLCGKAASEHPGHVWKLSAAGRRKFFTTRTLSDVRNPDAFGMYTFNDHHAYGDLEVVQNLFLDFEEAADNCKEQWAVCEALAFFAARDCDMQLADDGELIDETYKLIGRLFLSMLATLDRKGYLSPTSEIENLGLIMAIFADMAGGLRDVGICEESTDEPLGAKKDKKKWSPHAFEEQVVAYARKHNIKLVGPPGIDEVVKGVDKNAALPDPAGDADPFGWAKALKAYKTQHGGTCEFLSKRALKGTAKIGGDYLDITTWTSKERAEYAFSGRDPFPPKDRAAIKNGFVISLL